MLRKCLRKMFRDDVRMSPKIPRSISEKSVRFGATRETFIKETIINHKGTEIAPYRLIGASNCEYSTAMPFAIN